MGVLGKQMRGVCGTCWDRRCLETSGGGPRRYLEVLTRDSGEKLSWKGKALLVL